MSVSLSGPSETQALVQPRDIDLPALECALDDLGFTVRRGDTAVSRHGPWPAGDALFDIELEGAGVFVAGPRQEELRSTLAERGVDTLGGALDGTNLVRAAIVVLTTDGRLHPAHAACAAAARVVVTDAPEGFGFHSGIDHCTARTDDDLADLAESAHVHLPAFRAMRIHARAAAQAHRASTVFAELAFDLGAA